MEDFKFYLIGFIAGAIFYEICFQFNAAALI